MRHARLSAAVVLLLATAGCNKADVVPGDSAGVEARLAEMQSDLQSLKDENAALKRAYGIDSSETANTSQALAKRGDQIARLEAEVAALKARSVVPPPGTAPAESGDVPVSGPASIPASLQPAADGQYAEETLVAFDKIYDAVLKRRAAEEQLKNLRVQLARAGVTLTSEQEATVVKLQKKFQDKRQEIFNARQGTTTGDADREAMRTKQDELRTQFEAELRAALPTVEGDKVVAAMKQGYPGYFPQTNRTERRPGMAR